MHSICETCAHRKGNVCQQVFSGNASVQTMQSCPLRYWPTASMQGQFHPDKASQFGLQPAQNTPDKRIAPYREGDGRRWEGSAPWRDVPVSVILPIIEYNRTLDLVLEAIRRQTVKSVVYLIDTGSYLTTDRIAALRDYRTEVIVMRMQGWWHPSWAVAAALDAAWACVNTPYAFFTHDDCFIKQQDNFEQMIALCKDHHVVGHQISPREKATTEHDFGHTFLMIDVDKMHQLPMTWNMRAYGVQTGVNINPTECKMGHPDTESMMNHQLHKAGMIPSFDKHIGSPLFTGKEGNFVRNEDEWMDHCRSMTCGFLYSNEHAKKVSVWVDDAMKQAQQRMKEWK